MTTLSYSQDTYPKVITLNKDTVVAITPVQLKETNKIFIQRDYYKELDSIKTEIISDQDIIMRDQEEIVSNSQFQVSVLNEENDNLKDANKDLNKKLARKTKWSNVKTVLLSIGATTIIVLICL